MHNQVSEILSDKGSEVASIGPDSSVLDAVEEMNRRGIGALLVMQGARAVGIFTERDVLVRVVAASRDPSTTRVSQVMTHDLVAISPETTVHDAMVTVTNKRCRHLPVIQNGEVLGMVSAGDLTRWVVRDQENHIKDLEIYVMRG